MDGPGCLPDPAAGERARRVQYHGAGLQHPPRDLAGRCSRLDRRREDVRRESGQNRAPHIDPRRPGAPSTGLPAPNRQITWDRRKSWLPKPPSPPPPEFPHGLLREGLAAARSYPVGARDVPTGNDQRGHAHNHARPTWSAPRRPVDCNGRRGLRVAVPGAAADWGDAAGGGVLGSASLYRSSHNLVYGSSVCGASMICSKWE